MGARGKLKLVNPLTPVPEALKGTAAAGAPTLAPVKTAAVVADPVLSQLWDEIVPELDRAGLLAPSDGLAVEMCLRHFRAARVASDELAGATATVWDAKNERTMKHPAEVVFRSESLAFLEYAKQLGMTFVARARTPGAGSGAGGTDAGEDNPFLPASAAGR